MQAGGQEFESLHLHSDTKVSITYLENFIQNDKMIKYLFDQDIVITVKFFKLLMMQRYASKRLSKKERRVDALALRADERRDKLRKAAGRCK